MRRIAATCLLAAAAAACGVQLESPPSLSPDAGSGGGGDASLPDTPDAAPRCSNGRVVYLNFEGVTLAASQVSDATQNRASWMTIAQGMAPRYRSGAADRDQQIASITTGVRQQLSAFPVTVVTQRPATGPYVMIVFGGDRDQVGSRFGGAVNTLDCGDTAKSDVAWISDGVTGTQRVVNFAVGAIGFGLGLSATLDPADCMCGWDNACTQDQTAACKLSPMISRDPAANQRCAGLTSQNEVDAFDAAFCR